MTSFEARLFAKMMTINCVRNTVIEKYHCQGKLTDDDMKAFNKEVVNRLYTFLDCMFNRSDKERDLFLGKMAAVAEAFTAKWDEPELDKNLWSGAKTMKERIKQIRQLRTSRDGEQSDG